MKVGRTHFQSLRNMQPLELELKSFFFSLSLMRQTHFFNPESKCLQLRDNREVLHIIFWQTHTIYFLLTKHLQCMSCCFYGPIPGLTYFSTQPKRILLNTCSKFFVQCRCEPSCYGISHLQLCLIPRTRKKQTDDFMIITHQSKLPIIIIL